MYKTTLTLILILIMRDKIYERISLISFSENIILLFFFIDFYFKFKVDSLSFVNKYILLLKYLQTIKMLLIILTVFFSYISAFRDIKT